MYNENCTLPFSDDESWKRILVMARAIKQVGISTSGSLKSAQKMSNYSGSSRVDQSLSKRLEMAKIVEQIEEKWRQ